MKYKKLRARHRMIDITLVDFILIVGQKMKFGLLECTPDLFINLAELILIQMKPMDECISWCEKL